MITFIESNAAECTQCSTILEATNYNEKYSCKCNNVTIWGNRDFVIHVIKESKEYSDWSQIRKIFEKIEKK